jgi:hypothetical protein
MRTWAWRNEASATATYALSTKPFSLSSMETHTSPEDLILDLRALATYVRRGGEVEWNEPDVRGKKGPDRAARRMVSVVIRSPARFDAIRWKLMTER